MKVRALETHAKNFITYGKLYEARESDIGPRNIWWIVNDNGVESAVYKYRFSSPVEETEIVKVNIAEYTFSVKILHEDNWFLVTTNGKPVAKFLSRQDAEDYFKRITRRLK